MITIFGKLRVCSHLHCDQTTIFPEQNTKYVFILSAIGTERQDFKIN